MSNDLISRQELLDALDENVLFVPKVMEDVINGLSVIEGNNGWIPCRERLPEESLESVIGWDEYRERCCFVQYYNGQWILGNSNASVKIVAWMPLPNPYKEQDH